MAHAISADEDGDDGEYERYYCLMLDAERKDHAQLFSGKIAEMII